MIGFACVPDFSTASDGKSTFIVYNIHINGVYHSSLRYSQLLELSTELKANFDTTQLEEFPPKHWRSSLSDVQQNTRRVLLERFIQSVCQNRVIGPSVIVKEFLFGAQKASSELTIVSGDLDVYLVNGKKVTLTVNLSDRTDQVLEQVCSQIEMNPELTYYFGLFLEREEPSNTIVVSPLTDYESPLISLHSINKGEAVHRVTLRQNFWDVTFVPSLLDDKVAKNMLYIEALHAVAHGHIDVAIETKEKLAAMKSKGQKKEYLECVCGLPQFGYRQLEGFVFNHPTEGLEGCVRVGKQEVTTYTTHGRGVWAQCKRYPLNRIRSWKVGFDTESGVCWLRMNCQVGVDEFVWVSLLGECAIYLSLCLHSTVNELLRVRGKQPIRSPTLQPITRAPRDFPHVLIDHTSTNGSLESSTPSSEGQSSPVIEPTTRQRLSSSTSGTDGGAASPDGGVVSSLNKDVPISKPKKTKKSSKVGVSDTENPTFNFGTDDDL